MGVDLRHVVLPGSMGPTEAGFLYGLARLGAPVTVHLVSIEYGLDEMDARIDAVFRAVAGRLGAVGDWRPWTRRYDGYLGPGYAVPTAAAYDAIATFASREALLLETTYTAKTFAGALDLVRRSVIPPGEAACLLHTGGVPALYGQADAVARALPCETA
jgi:1-aminocyclopropane-1-carboxylate deaminase/D-cysteine desulfhydrase-like pyridoxal-dependent ACC family enzyme